MTAPNWPKWIVTAALTLSGVAGAADIKLGLNTSATLGCQVAGVRAGIQEGRFGVYAQGAYCASNVVGQSGNVAFGGGVTFDIFSSGGLTTYALVGGDIQGSQTVFQGAVGLRYGVALVPVEGYVEAGVQLTPTALKLVPSPRVAVGVNYRINVPNLQGTIPAPIKLDDGTQNRVEYAGTAPAECKLTPEQDVASARGAASAAANDALSAAASAYSSVYSNASFSVTITSVSITGNSAKVGGSVKLSATQRSDGKQVSGTYGGTVSLVREGCGWRATGYKQSGGLP